MLCLRDESQEHWGSVGQDRDGLLISLPQLHLAWKHRPGANEGRAELPWTR